MFLIICAGLKKNPSELASIYWSGMMITVVLAFFIAGTSYDKKRNKKRKVKLNSGDRVNKKQEQAHLRRSNNIEPIKNETIESEIIENEIENNGEIKRNIIKNEIVENDIIENENEVIKPRSINGDFILRPTSFGIVENKVNEPKTQPLIFATRSDPTILIHEYPDRLEYFKRTRNGMVLMETKYKN